MDATKNKQQRKESMSHQSLGITRLSPVSLQTRKKWPVAPPQQRGDYVNIYTINPSVKCWWSNCDFWWSNQDLWWWNCETIICWWLNYLLHIDNLNPDFITASLPNPMTSRVWAKRVPSDITIHDFTARIAGAQPGSGWWWMGTQRYYGPVFVWGTQMDNIYIYVYIYIYMVYVRGICICRFLWNAFQI